MNARIFSSIVLVLICLTKGWSQSNWYQQDWSSSKINLEIKKTLNPLRVLYIAAHPDDENTRLISWMVNDLHADVAYLSLTNGSGGQNLISEDIGATLGAIREQELLAARRIDGGKQFFTTALDFGYSKSYEETFEKWDKQKILEQVVYRIRSYQPDIIITRFSPSTQGLRSTHGHHTASAILAVEAYEAAADAQRFQHQLKELSTWQTQAIYWNTSWWSYGSQEKLDSIALANPDYYVKLNVDAYVPELGKSTSEIAAASRSMHKSQGFGTMSRYGEQHEYLQLLRGKANARDMLNPFYVHLSSYFHGPLQQAMERQDKSALILQGIAQGVKDKKLDDRQVQRLQEIWLHSLGLRAFVTCETPLVMTGEVAVTLQLIHYGDTALHLEELRYKDQQFPINKVINSGQLFTEQLRIPMNEQEQPSVQLILSGVNVELPVVYRSSDPVKGELIQGVQLVHNAMVHVLNTDILDVNGQTEKVRIEITPATDVDHLIIYFTDQFEFAFDQTVSLKAQQKYTFELDAPATSCLIEVNCNEGPTQKTDIRLIEYDHLPYIHYQRPLLVRIHHINAVCKAKRVGYVMGAGDKVPDAITALGAELVLLDYQQVTPDELKTFDAVVFGIRALNVLEDIDVYIQKFYDYSENGGTLIMQYNTSHRLKTTQIGPKGYPITLSRGRVTHEEALVKCVNDQQVLNQPNKIEDKQWDSWVQERGLYFPSKWSDAYDAPLSMNDPDEEPLNGALLILQHGKGHFVYTGISFFRELPAGVDGAYKLWANLLSL